MEERLIRRAHTIATALLALAASSVAAARPVRAAVFPACTAADVTAHDAGCPSTGACSITQTFQVGDGCTLDFGTRDVMIGATGTIDINSGGVTIKAGNFTVAAGGLIDGRGNASTAPDNLGGFITIQTTGSVTVQKSGRTSGAIDVSAKAQAGTIAIFAGSAITVAGRINADQLTGAATATGGTVQLNAGSDIVTFVGSDISASGGNQSIGGGEVDLLATGKITLGDAVDVSGSCGGTFNLSAGTAATVDLVNSNGTGDGGGGGCIDLTSGTSTQTIDQLVAQGNTSSTAAGGGGGGVVCINAQYGDLTVGSNIMAEGATPDGAGGEIDMCTPGVTTIAAGKMVSTRGNGAQGSGGVVCMQSDLGITSLGLVDASGGAGGGEVDMCARANLTLTGKVDVSGRSVGGNGGRAALAAGENGQGSLSVMNTLDVTGGGCMTGSVGCGLGGTTSLTACNLTVTSTGSILAGAPTGGQNSFTARKQLTISGKVNAAKTTASGTDGTNFFQYPSRKPPIIGNNLVMPVLSTMAALDTCTVADQANCLIPCPVCGDNMVEFPETCDNNVGTPLSCDGCSVFCQLENCDDGDVCTTDSCDPMRGCRHVPVSPACVSPTPTPATPTHTRTPGTPSPTPTGTPTRANTTAATPTMSVPPSGSVTPSVGDTATATPSETPTLSPTETPTPGPPGDVNCDASVTAADLPALITLITSATVPNSCSGADVNGDSVIDENDVGATISALFES